MDRVMRMARAALGAGLVFWAAGLGVVAVLERHRIHPFSSIGWLAEYGLLAAALALYGALLLMSIRWRTSGWAFGVLWSLGVASFFAELRYWWQSLALLCVLGLALAFVEGWRGVREGRRTAWLALGLGTASLLVFGGFLGVGTLRWLRLSKVPGAASLPAAPAAEYSGKDCEGFPAQVDAANRPSFEQLRGALDADLQPVYCELVRDDLRAGARGPRLSTDLTFEAFRVKTYLSAGVVPKRYFGFFDEAGDTAGAERALRETLQRAVPLANQYAESSGLGVAISEKEVAVTFLAEGGALLLTDGTDHLDRIHPVRDAGLDDFRRGLGDYRALVERLDGEFGTDLGRLTVTFAGRVWLLHPLTLREALLVTTVMYLWEKALCASLAAKEGRALMALPPSLQFITTSLLYNCGQLFSAERVEQLAAFDTADYLADLNAHRKDRPALPVYARVEARARLVAGEGFPVQLTSWSAMVHVLQRYGAWVALDRAGVFDAENHFVRR